MTSIASKNAWEEVEQRLKRTSKFTFTVNYLKEDHLLEWMITSQDTEVEHYKNKYGVGPFIKNQKTESSD